MNTPDKIWLINMGDEVAWHGEQFPDSELLESDTVGYVKESSHQQLQQENDELKAMVNELREAARPFTINLYTTATNQVMRDVNDCLALQAALHKTEAQPLTDVIRKAQEEMREDIALSYQNGHPKELGHAAYVRNRTLPIDKEE